MLSLFAMRRVIFLFFTLRKRSSTPIDPKMLFTLLKGRNEGCHTSVFLFMNSLYIWILDTCVAFLFFLLYPSNRVFFQNMCIIKTIDLISFLFQLEHNSSLQNDNHHHHHIPKKVHVYGSDVFNVINVKASKQAANIDEFDSF